MVQRLEDDLGVKVQEVQLPGLQYGFQIWDTYMGLPDKEGNVGSTCQHKAENSNCTDMMDCLTKCEIKKGNHSIIIFGSSGNNVTAEECLDEQLQTFLCSIWTIQ